MRKNSTEKKRRRLTRVELTRALGVSLTTIDRLVALGGLRSAGRRGRAKVYDVATARRVARKLAPAEIAAAAVLISDHRTHAEDLQDRRRALDETWIADAAWQPKWLACVAAVAQMTASWPERLAKRLGPLDAEGAHRAAAADGPLVLPPPSAADCETAAELVREWLADPARWPLADVDLVAAAAHREVSPWVVRRQATRAGLTRQGSAWHRPTGPRPWLDQAIPAALRRLDHEEAAATGRVPLLRPLLAELAHAIRRHPSTGALAAALSMPAAGALPAAPRTADAARAQWRAARAAYRRRRVAVRRGHRRRADVLEQIERTTEAFRATWWNARGELAAAAGEPARVRQTAERLRRDTLETLGSQVPGSLIGAKT